MPSDRKASDFRLRKQAEYQRVYKAGRKKHGKLLAYFFAQRSLLPQGTSPVLIDGPRVGLTVPKALGKAVVRNRIKRRMRVVVRACLPLLSSSVDVILHPRKSVEDCPFAALVQEVSLVFRSVQAQADRQNSANSVPNDKGVR